MKPEPGAGVASQRSYPVVRLETLSSSGARCLLWTTYITVAVAALLTGVLQLGFGTRVTRVPIIRCSSLEFSTFPGGALGGHCWNADHCACGSDNELQHPVPAGNESAYLYAWGGMDVLDGSPEAYFYPN